LPPKGPFQKLLEHQVNKTPKDIRAERVALMKEIRELRGRPLVTYATNIELSGPNVPAFIHPQDIIPLSEVLDSVEGDAVDFLLETPGGLAEVTVDIVNLLRPRFRHVSFIIPHYAMSAGTILAMSGDEILMDHRSSLGAIDPQFLGSDGRPQPAQAVLAGIETIKKQVDANNGNLHPVYIPILRNVDPGKLQSALNASELSRVLVTDWLAKYKFRDWTTHSSSGQPVTDDERSSRAREIAENLCSHQNWLSHSRLIKIPELEKLRLKIVDYGQNPKLQEKIWALWVNLHFFMSSSNIYKIYESEAVEMYKVAVTQNQPMQMVPNPGVNPAIGAALASFATAGLRCNTCGTDYKIQVNFAPNVPLQPGSEAFPKSGSFVCRKCHTVHNLQGLKMQIEAATKRTVIL
jgi:ATP-dependent protease ClpP protease subunit